VLKVATNGEEIARRLKKRADAFGPAHRRTQDRIRSVVLEESRTILATRIYAIPIPRSKKTGKAKWKRTQDLYQKETVRIRGGNLELVNTSDHAAAREALGTPQGRPIRSPGVQSVQWQSEAVRNRLDDIRGFYHEMNRLILETGG
jgi:hypothetical protein